MGSLNHNLLVCYFLMHQVLRFGFYFSVCLSLFVRCRIPPGISDLTNYARNWCILSSIMQSRYRNGEYICPGRGNREVISTVSSIVVNKIRKEWYHRNIAKGATEPRPSVEFIHQINCFKIQL